MADELSQAAQPPAPQIYLDLAATRIPRGLVGTENTIIRLKSKAYSRRMIWADGLKRTRITAWPNVARQGATSNVRATESNPNEPLL